MISIVDYGMGNLHSVAKALEHAAPGARVVVSADPAEILAADRVVFPGVGAMRDCMAEIRRLGFDELVAELITAASEDEDRAGYTSIGTGDVAFCQEMCEL